MRSKPSRKSVFVGFALVGLLLALIGYSMIGRGQPSSRRAIFSLDDKKQRESEDSTPDLAGAKDQSSAQRTASSSSHVFQPSDVPLKTRRAERGAQPDRSKLPVVDLQKSASETPPWPDGPRVMVEVATENKRFVNLRPNNVGILPTINIGTDESVSIQLAFPDASAGENIYFELADGGFFLNTEKSGQILSLGDTKKLELSISSDDRAGYCKLLFRQAGHTRVIPFWVGPPLPLAQSEQN